MEGNSFSIGSDEFKVRKLSAMKQFHVTRRIAPLLGELIPVAQLLGKNKTENLSEDQQLEQVAKFVTPIMEGLSKLSDKDAEFVLYTLLSCVEYKQPQFEVYASIVVDDRLQIQNLELPVLLQAAGQAFMFNLKGFFGALPKLSQ